MVSCQKGPTRHANAWQIGPFWQDTIDIKHDATAAMGFFYWRELAKPALRWHYG